MHRTRADRVIEQLEAARERATEAYASGDRAAIQRADDALLKATWRQQEVFASRPKDTRGEG